ncbi:hypothetical protein T492DRAFT_863925 [Pavlovales sp. CCMP2436]|nr:hypothetical protein T492DRAFT_863925 [Pavlovales sp. CCMP2436]
MDHDEARSHVVWVFSLLAEIRHGEDEAKRMRGLAELEVENEVRRRVKAGAGRIQEEAEAHLVQVRRSATSLACDALMRQRAKFKAETKADLEMRLLVQREEHEKATRWLKQEWDRSAIALSEKDEMLAELTSELVKHKQALNSKPSMPSGRQPRWAGIADDFFGGAPGALFGAGQMQMLQLLQQLQQMGPPEHLQQFQQLQQYQQEQEQAQQHLTPQQLAQQQQQLLQQTQLAAHLTQQFDLAQQYPLEQFNHAQQYPLKVQVCKYL